MNKKQAEKHNSEVLNDMDAEMEEIISLQDWGGSYLKVTLKALPRHARDYKKLNPEQKDIIDNTLQDALNTIEDIFK